MRSGDKIWIGADPGGARNFGLAILRADGSVDPFCVDCAENALKLIKAHVNVRPDGVGVDSPLWWSSGPSGDRKADQRLRKTYTRLKSGQVQAANSLRGAALVQGAMFVYRMRQEFPNVRVTETHPKVLLHALDMENNWDAFCKKYSVTSTIPMETEPEYEHKRDAIISAVAAREGFEGRWNEELSTDRDQYEQDPSQYWLSPVRYFWPEKLCNL